MPDVVDQILGQRIERECDQLDRMAEFLDRALLSDALPADTVVMLRGQVADCRTSVTRAGRDSADGRGAPQAAAPAVAPTMAAQ